MGRSQLYTALAGLALLACAACSSTARARPAFDLQGHRGARALWPENTVPGFHGALDLGVTTLELDTVVSADGRVVVSHEPWFSAAISLTPEGRGIAAEREREHAIYALPYAEVRRYDVGRRGNPRFPRQQRIPAVKPTLLEVIGSSDLHARAVGRALPFYNVEIKSRAEWDGTLTPPVEEFAALVVDVIEHADVVERTTIQSFDLRALRAVRELAPDIELALLIAGEPARAPGERLAELGFRPGVYSPQHDVVDAELVAACRALDVRLIPWTVNEPARMAELIALGVHGLITDTPDVALGLLGP